MRLYSGAGNTFCLIDHRNPWLSPDQIPALCDERRLDGCILVENSSIADASMRIFNRDGGEAEMCGNGLRCFIHFLRELGFQQNIFHIETLAGIQKGWFVDHHICLELVPPKDLKLNLLPNLHFLNTGVPHAVCFVEQVDAIDVTREGKRLRFSDLLAPAGANINFVSIQNTSQITLRTYERGVEAETGACGTGAVAAALISHKIHHLLSPITVLVRSGEQIQVSFNPDWSTVTMTGPVKQLN
jgi:diaminopimelate epimerase